MGSDQPQGRLCGWRLDDDDLVFVTDLLLLVVAGFGPCGDRPTDFNDDVLVNVDDLSALSAGFGTRCARPAVDQRRGEDQAASSS